MRLLVSSGRQIVLSEQPAHLGESSSGAGIYAVRGESPGAGDGVFGFGDQRVINRNAHALAGLLVEDD